MSDEQSVQTEEQQDPRDRLDPETRARRDAALMHVRKYGDPVLRSRALATPGLTAAQKRAQAKVDYDGGLRRVPGEGVQCSISLSRGPRRR